MKAVEWFHRCRWYLTFLSCLPFLKTAMGYSVPFSAFQNIHRSRRVMFTYSSTTFRANRRQPRCYSQFHFTRESTACHLFFRTSESTSVPRRRTVKTETFERLQSPKLSIPLFIEFEDDSCSKVGEKLSVRHMRPEDIQKVMPMCVEEFGQGSTMSLLDFPFYDYRKISNWWDRVYFEPMVFLSLRSKVNANLNPGPKAKDPTMLVLCRSCESINSREDVIGIVEVSLQAPEADKNPPPFPVPLWFKALYCRLTGYRFVGWVGNLLIDPRYRGLGYSKILMAATEGIAKSWDCHYMYLHADADYRSGKTAQSLYKGLGYEVVTDRGPEYAWMTGNAADNNPFSSIRIIEGVPLLCFYKRLQS